MDSRADLADDDGRGGLEDDVGDEEDKGDDGLGVMRLRDHVLPSKPCFRGATHISVADQHQVLAHIGEDGGSKIGAIHKRHAVHEADRGDEAAVDPADNLLLLLGAELGLGDRDGVSLSLDRIPRIGQVHGDLLAVMLHCDDWRWRAVGRVYRVYVSR